MRVGGGVVSALVAPHKESGLRVSGVAGLSHGVRFASRADQKIRSTEQRMTSDIVSSAACFLRFRTKVKRTYHRKASAQKGTWARLEWAENITKKLVLSSFCCEPPSSVVFFFFFLF